MSKYLDLQVTDEAARNVVVQLRDAYRAINDLVPVRLVEHGFSDFRPAHSVVFEHLDTDSGTTVSALADRANMTKQAMAQLVGHLEKHGYVERTPSPSDGRAKLVLPTARGREVFDVARGWIPDLHAEMAALLGTARFEQLRRDLDTIRRQFGSARRVDEQG
jgi:DNA-binding MarR family transcriptional regulator